MNKLCLIFFLITITCCYSCSNGNGGSSNDSAEEDASVYNPTNTVVFKTIDGIELNAHIFEPLDLNQDDRRPALVYFHGGGWYFDPGDGYKECDYFASMGMVAISFEYRLSNFDNITPVECITDSKSAVRWTRNHADELHIDPDKIVVSGGSAGGHLAACTGILEGFDEINEETDVGASPNAMILFSAVLITAEDEWFNMLVGDRTAAENCSPYHHIRQGLPPTILFHGTSDTMVPYDTAEAFTEKMVQYGNQCELYSFDSGHMFHLEDDDYFIDVMDLAYDFLDSLGYLDSDT